jgi:hypothetical protein
VLKCFDLGLRILVVLNIKIDWKLEVLHWGFYTSF